MQRFADHAYVLRTQELGDADLIVGLFAAEAGKVRGVAQSARRSRKRFGGALEPMTRVQLRWTEKSGRELHRIDALDCERSFAAMQADPVHQAACAVFSEITETFTHENQADPPYFRLLGAVLEALEDGADPWSLVRYFQIWTLRIHGLLPDFNGCSRCAAPIAERATRFVAPDGNLVCPACGAGEGGRQLTAVDLQFLRLICRRPPGEMGSDGPGEGSVGLDRLLGRTLERFAERPLRSLSFLRSMSHGPAGSGSTTGRP